VYINENLNPLPTG